MCEISSNQNMSSFVFLGFRSASGNNIGRGRLGLFFVGDQRLLPGQIHSVVARPRWQDQQATERKGTTHGVDGDGELLRHETGNESDEARQNQNDLKDPLGFVLTIEIEMNRKRQSFD